MIKRITLLTTLLIGGLANAQVGINTDTPHVNSDLELGSKDKALLLNRVATIGDIASPVDGMVAYAVDQKCFKGYQDDAWVDITTCSPITSAMAFVDVKAYNGVSVINSEGIGYNGEAVPAASTIDIDVTTTVVTPYSFVATDATTGLEYTATGNFPAAGTYTVTLENNGATMGEFTYGTINMTLTGASNTLALAPRIDIKSIPASATEVVDVTHGAQTWMDRNLGARRVATALNDVFSYGNHYQWGRPADGHEISVWNGATLTSGRGFADATALEALATSDTPGHPNFILTSVNPYDWRSDNNNDRWQTANQGPCPAGYHVPTNTEWNTADIVGAWNNNTDTYNSALRLPSAGTRLRIFGLLSNQGTFGYYWSSTVIGTNARLLNFYSTAAFTVNSNRAFGFSVRCLKD